jgi:hypothetical protein
VADDLSFQLRALAHPYTGITLTDDERQLLVDAAAEISRLRYGLWTARTGKALLALEAVQAENDLLHEDVVRLLIERNAERALADQLAALVEDLTTDEECDLDHHGYCQTHMWFNWTSSCPHTRAPAALAAHEAARKEAQ